MERYEQDSDSDPEKKQDPQNYGDLQRRVMDKSVGTTTEDGIMREQVVVEREQQDSDVQFIGVSKREPLTGAEKPFIRKLGLANVPNDRGHAITFPKQQRDLGFLRRFDHQDKQTQTEFGVAPQPSTSRHFVAPTPVTGMNVQPLSSDERAQMNLKDKLTFIDSLKKQISAKNRQLQYNHSKCYHLQNEVDSLTRKMKVETFKYKVALGRLQRGQAPAPPLPVPEPPEPQPGPSRIPTAAASGPEPIYIDNIDDDSRETLIIQQDNLDDDFDSD